MSDFVFGQPGWAIAFWIIPALALLMVFSFWRKHKALARFATHSLLSHLLPTVSWARQYVRAALLLVGFAFLIFCLMRPQWGVEKIEMTDRGIDIMVLLDVSKSMLAEDVAPNRLERAKTDIRDLVEALEGDRIGLIAFAGASQMLCPLTFDYSFFLTLLEDANTGTVAMGGTLIGDAIRKATAGFQDDIKNHKVILLITDGEDHETLPTFAAREAKDKGIHIFTIGLGSESPTPIPFKKPDGTIGFVTDSEGNVHNTRLDLKTLTEISQLVFRESSETKPLNMAEAYEKHIAVLPEREIEHKKQERHTDRYQWFLAAALALFIVEPLIRTRRKNP